MKKAMILILAISVFAMMAMAQNPTYTQGTGITGIDKLGAHQNGGRGCSGCHAPHSGGAGGGGNKATSAALFNDANSGNIALWGQDTTPLLGISITTGGGGYIETLPASGVDSVETTGILFCLSCHDGNIAKGGMMTNNLYEQTIGKLPLGVYGPRTIPTLLGNDGSTGGNYSNDHPVGINATLTAVLGSNLNAFSAVSTSGVVTYTAGVNTNYDKFVSNYGNFFQGRATVGGTTLASAFVVCTTCHTPHTMYTAGGTYAGVKGTYPTYFFLVAPYNPGSLQGDVTGTKASSATQFCRSCHFTGAGGSNEGSGIMNVTTAF